MILLYLLLSSWPTNWYQEYSALNWGEMYIVSAEFSEESSTELAAKVISSYSSGYGDPYTIAMQALEIDSTDSNVWTALAFINLQEDSVLIDSIFEKAFEFANEMDPVLYEVYSYWLFLSGNLSEALIYSNTAVVADSSFAASWLTLSMIYAEMNKTEKAIEISEKSLLYVPGCFPLLRQYADLLVLNGNTLEAIDVYKEIISLNSNRMYAYQELAYLYLRLNKNGDALKVYREVVSIDPDNYPWAWDGLGLLFLENNKYVSADSAFQNSIDIYFENPIALFNLAKLRSEDQPASAISMLELCVQIDSTDIDGWQELAFLYESVEDFISANFALRKCIEIEPKAWLYGELGWVLENRGLYDEAALIYEESVATDSLYLYGWQRRGSLFVQSENPDLAIDWFNKALSVLETEDALILRELGSLAVLEDDFALAEEYYKRALLAEPSYATPWLLLARVQYMLGDYTESNASTYEYLALSEDSAVAYANIIFTNESLYYTSDSLEYFALEKWPDLWVKAGWNAIDNGFNALALEYAERAFQLTLETPWQYISLAELFADCNLEDKQRVCYDIAASMENDDYAVTIRIADYYYRHELYQEAIDMLLGAYEKYPWNEELSTSLAEAYLFYDESDKAKELLTQVVNNNPTSTYAICYLGLIEENKGNVGEALEYYLEALRIEPGYPYAEDRIKYITSDAYNPTSARNNSSLFSWNGWIDLSSTGGNVDEQKYGGGGSVSLNYSEDGSCSFEVSARSEIKNDFEVRKTGWASIAFEQFLTNHLYLGGSSSWDRQPLTVRPWQVSSYLAAGWKSWPVSWFWIAPETGAGLVNTKWSTEQGRINDFTAFASLNTWVKSSIDWLPTLWISGSVYVPPDDLSKLVANGVGELEFKLLRTISLVGGISFDYTRTPVVSSWEKLDSEIYIRLRF